MPVSQNGYSANDRSKIASYLVPGTRRRVAVRKGDVSVVLLDFAAWWHANVEPIDQGQLDDWGYAERKVRGSASVLSNHASGTAIDLNALRHPLGTAPGQSLSADRIALVRQRLRQYDGVLRWGGDYVRRKDVMHVEINRGAAAVRTVADRIRRGALATPGSARQVRPGTPLSTGHRLAGLPTLKAGARGPAVTTLQRELRLPADGIFGPQTEARVRVHQRNHGLAADGIVGPATWADLARTGAGAA